MSKKREQPRKLQEICFYVQSKHELFAVLKRGNCWNQTPCHSKPSYAPHVIACSYSLPTPLHFQVRGSLFRILGRFSGNWYVASIQNDHRDVRPCVQNRQEPPFSQAADDQRPSNTLTAHDFLNHAIQASQLFIHPLTHQLILYKPHDGCM